MAQVKPDAVIDQIDREIKMAVEEAVKSAVPGIGSKAHHIAQDALKKMSRKVGAWVTVPDSAVRA